MRNAPAMLLHSAPDEIEAAMMQAALEAHGIPNTLVQGTTGGARIEPHRFELWIPTVFAEAGRAVITECQHGIQSSATSSRAWVCTQCGEMNERGFQICWKCNAESVRS